MAAKCHTHSKGYRINETYIFLALNVEPEADDYRRNTKIVDIRSSVKVNCVTCTKALLLAVSDTITKSQSYYLTSAAIWRATDILRQERSSGSIVIINTLLQPHMCRHLKIYRTIILPVVFYMGVKLGL
jgi:hypothetical protein